MIPCKTLKPSYNKLSQISKGSYGAVFKCQSQIGQIYALKQLDYMNQKETQGFPITALRQIKILSKLDHINILKIKQVVYQQQKKRPAEIYLVLDYMQYDLLGLLRQNGKLSFPIVKNILKQSLQGLNYLHQNKIIHRDLKTANILISNKGVVKIADFGLAKEFNPDKANTIHVVTLWYRAPQILLGDKHYNQKVDIWALGVLIIELLIGRPLFGFDTQAAVIFQIFKTLGTPNNQLWMQAYNLPNYKKYETTVSYSNEINSLLQKTVQAYNDKKFILLINKMLSLNPNLRFSAQKCLQTLGTSGQNELQEFLKDKQQIHGMGHPIKRQRFE